MATSIKNLSEYDKNIISNGADYKIGIVVSEWNGQVTEALLEGAIQTLKNHDVQDKHMTIVYVPGAFELPLGAQSLLEQQKFDGVLTIGTVIQGETKHFDFVCNGATQGIMQVMLNYNTPISFCVLTDNSIQQSIDRSGGKHGNKGIECAVSLLKMIQLQRSLK
jgi:6,7-dimethyl-8-ribityllumazine synthase